jgi:hypothetical protein
MNVLKCARRRITEHTPEGSRTQLELAIVWEYSQPTLRVTSTVTDDTLATKDYSAAIL